MTKSKKLFVYPDKELKEESSARAACFHVAAVAPLRRSSIEVVSLDFTLPLSCCTKTNVHPLPDRRRQEANWSSPSIGLRSETEENDSACTWPCANKLNQDEDTDGGYHGLVREVTNSSRTTFVPPETGLDREGTGSLTLGRGASTGTSFQLNAGCEDPICPTP